MFEIFIALIPVVGGILNSLITPIREEERTNLTLLNNSLCNLKRKTISFVLESYIPVLFRCRPIPSGVLKNCCTGKFI